MFTGHVPCILYDNVQIAGDKIPLNLVLSHPQIARRRQPSSGFSIKSTSKPFKHLEFLPYTYIRNIINFDDTEGKRYMQCVLQKKVS